MQLAIDEAWRRNESENSNMQQISLLYTQYHKFSLLRAPNSEIRSISKV